MSDTSAETWLEGVSPEDRTGAVAARTLQSRLEAVLRRLPLAAEKAEEDVEYVHHLRVWTRRATAALHLYEELIPRRRFLWLKKQLKRVRRAANDARDCDVLVGRLRARPSGRGVKRWLEQVRAERAEAQKALVAVHARLGHGDRFARRIGKLLQRVRSRGEEKVGGAAARFGEWAREHLRRAAERFFGAVPADPADEAALHQLRIRGKELRYQMELLAGAFPDSCRTHLYPTVEAMQDRLGEVNDLATATARLRQKIEAAGDRKKAASWRGLLRNEQAELDQARQKFWAWCTPQVLQDLRDGFEALLREPTHPGSPRKGRPPGTPSAPPRAPRPATDPPPGDGDGSPGCGTTPKARIVGELGEPVLLLPALVNEALAANDRAKYRMTLLQAARAQADHPDAAASDFRRERVACGITDDELDGIVPRSRKEGDDLYAIPAARRLHDGLFEDVRRMLASLRARDGAGAQDGCASAAVYERRLHALSAAAPAPADDSISAASITRLTSGQRGAGDSLHLLVMDLHKELNRPRSAWPPR
jgi:CHAD domain-containing protein